LFLTFRIDRTALVRATGVPIGSFRTDLPPYFTHHFSQFCKVFTVRRCASQSEIALD